MADRTLSHLLRRAGFGASADDLAVFSGLSYTQAVDRLVDYERLPDDVDTFIGQAAYLGTTSTGPFSPNTVITDARQRWLFRMVHSARPLQEKMTLFWHNYFATGYSKIASAVRADHGTRLMAAKASEDLQKQQGQVEMLRARALGSVRDLLVAVAQDPAMIIWLDGNSNTKAKPQENFGRELMELFTRGVGFYTEDDVYAAARVFTGWNLKTNGVTTDPSATFEFVYNAAQHDTAAKSFSFYVSDASHTIPARAAAAGQQDGIDLITALANHPETARRIATKLYAFFVSETNAPPAGFIDQLAAVYLQSGTVMKPVLRFLFNSSPFLDPANQYTRYAWPVEFVVRAIKEVGWTGLSAQTALSPLTAMGQSLYEPPNVAGWVLGANWFSTGAMLSRMNFASTLALNQKFRLATAAAPARQSTRTLVDYLLTRLSIPDPDASAYADLQAYAAAGGTWTGTDAQLQAKAAGLAHLILGSAAYQFI